MHTTHSSRTLTVSIEVEVYFRRERSVEGADADGNRGQVVEEWIPETAEVLTIVPPAVQEWAKVCAIEQFEREY